MSREIWKRWRRSWFRTPHRILHAVEPVRRGPRRLLKKVIVYTVPICHMHGGAVPGSGSAPPALQWSRAPSPEEPWNI